MLRITMLAAATALSTSLAFAAMSDRPEMLPGNMSNASAEQITSQLQALGYKQVQDVRLSGDVYTASAFWGDEAVSIHIDRELGEINNRLSPDVQTIHVRDNMTPAQFASSLEAIGYTNVHNVERSGNVFRATADMHGQTHDLRVDAEKGVVNRL